MFTALDINGNKIDASEADENNKYRCEACGCDLILRQGDIKAYHFAHQKNCICCDDWNYDMSDWHRNWQKKFPLENREVVKEYKGKKHRADVLLENRKIVIEFQHSNMTAKEFEERNYFYTNLGYRVIWLFDLTEQWDNDDFEEIRWKVYKWRWAKKTFEYFEISSNVELYFQFIDDDKINAYLEGVEKTGIDDFDMELDEYYSIHKNDVGFIAKVSWISDAGIKRFAIDKRDYDAQEFTRMFVVDKSERKNPYTDKGDLFELWNKYDMKIATFARSDQKGFIRIKSNPTDQYAKYKKVYGQFSMDKYSFKEKSVEIYNCDIKNWIIIWYK